MKYYKYIDIDNCQAVIDNSRRFVAETYAAILENKMSIFRQINWKKYISYCPEIMTAFSKYDLEPHSGFIYILYHQAMAPIHVDFIHHKRNLCRINIPVFNCEYSRTAYYKNRQIKYIGDTEPLRHFVDPGICSYIKYDEDDVSIEKVDEVVVDRPTILRVQEPHRVIIDKNHLPRVVLTLRTHKDPVYLLEEEEDDAS